MPLVFFKLKMREDRPCQWEVDVEVESEININPLSSVGGTGSDPPVLFRDVWLSSATAPVEEGEPDPDSGVILGVVEAMKTDVVRREAEADKLNNNSKKDKKGRELGGEAEESEKMEGEGGDNGGGDVKEGLGVGGGGELTELVPVPAVVDEDGGVGSLMMMEGEPGGTEADETVSSIGFNILAEAGIFLEEEVNDCLKEVEVEVKKEIETEDDGVGHPKDSDSKGPGHCYPDLLQKTMPFTKCRIVLTNEIGEGDHGGNGTTGSRPFMGGWQFDGKDHVFYDSVRKEDQDRMFKEIGENKRRVGGKAHGSGSLPSTSRKATQSGRVRKQRSRTRCKRQQERSGGSKSTKLASLTEEEEWTHTQLEKKYAVTTNHEDCHEDQDLNQVVEQGFQDDDGDDRLSTVSESSSSVSLFVPIVKRQEPRLRCFTCMKPFANPMQLQVHTRIHTGEMPYRCKKCGDGFIHYSYLTNHQKTVECGTQNPDEDELMPSSASPTSPPPSTSRASANFNDQLELLVAQRKDIELRDVSIFLTRVSHPSPKPASASETIPRKSSRHINKVKKEEGDLEYTASERVIKTEVSTSTDVSTDVNYPFFCPYCDEEFTLPKELIKHLPVHKGEKVPVIMPSSSKQSKSKINDRRHKIQSGIAGRRIRKQKLVSNYNGGRGIFGRGGNRKRQVPRMRTRNSRRSRDPQSHKLATGLASALTEEMDIKEEPLPTSSGSLPHPHSSLKRESQQEIKELATTIPEPRSGKRIRRVPKHFDQEDYETIYSNAGAGDPSPSKSRKTETKRDLGPKSNHVTKSNAARKLGRPRKCSTRQGSLDLHGKIQPEKKPLIQKSYECLLCGSFFGLHSMLLDHLKVTHQITMNLPLVSKIGSRVQITESPRDEEKPCTSASASLDCKPSPVKNLPRRSHQRKTRMNSTGLVKVEEDSGRVGDDCQGKTYKCLNCAKTFMTVPAIDSHMEAAHPNTDDGFICLEKEETPPKENAVGNQERFPLPQCEVRLVRCDAQLET